MMGMQAAEAGRRESRGIKERLRILARLHGSSDMREGLARESGDPKVLAKLLRQSDSMLDSHLCAIGNPSCHANAISERLLRWRRSGALGKGQVLVPAIQYLNGGEAIAIGECWEPVQGKESYSHSAAFTKVAVALKLQGPGKRQIVAELVGKADSDLALAIDKFALRGFFTFGELSDCSEVMTRSARWPVEDVVKAIRCMAEYGLVGPRHPYKEVKGAFQYTGDCDASKSEILAGDHRELDLGQAPEFRFSEYFGTVAWGIRMQEPERRLAILKGLVAAGHAEMVEELKPLVLTDPSALSAGTPGR